MKPVYYTATRAFAALLLISQVPRRSTFVQGLTLAKAFQPNAESASADISVNSPFNLLSRIYY